MPLQARRPPGHANRKVLDFAVDIRELRAQGHSLSAIRQALADAGVVVSISTVRREVLRAVPPVTPSSVVTAPAVLAQPAPYTPANHAVPVADQSGPLRGKAIAEAFVRSRPINPLFRKEPAR